MSSTIVVSCGWGDEGKGRLVDYLAREAQVIARYNGGGNAGHTIRVGDYQLVTHYLPSGILHPRKTVVLGHGMVIDPAALLEEIAALPLEHADILISKKAHVILPQLCQLDVDREQHSLTPIGTTGKGIGPAYEFKARRLGLRMGDLLDPDLVASQLEALLEETSIPPASLKESLRELRNYGLRLRRYLTDTQDYIYHCETEFNLPLLCEGAQGTMLDIDHGSYPYVTSSTAVAGGAVTGLGVNPRQIDSIIGVTKAYATRVGHGPFPTELTSPALTARLREWGHEWGATTGRPRRCGWLDLNVLRYAKRVNHLDCLALTKLDVIGQLPSINVGVDTVDGAVIYTSVSGWQEDISHCRQWEELPPLAQEYVRMIEQQVELPVKYLSVGPERDQMIEL